MNPGFMKTIVSKFLSLLILLALTSCHDDEIAVSPKLEGTWNWQSSCGGFVGCVYPTSKDSKTLTITETSVELNDNGKITMSGTYTVNSTTGDDNSRTYEMELNDGAIWTATIENNVLSIHNVVVTSVYKRTK